MLLNFAEMKVMDLSLGSNQEPTISCDQEDSCDNCYAFGPYEECDSCDDCDTRTED